MLTYFRADNFKSLLNVTFEPAGLNLLVGSNNAGKTNLCHALRFVSLTSRFSLQDAANQCTPEPWSLANVYLDKPTIDFSLRCHLAWMGEPLEFEYALSLTKPRLGTGQGGNQPLQVQSETLKVTGGQFQNTVLLDNQAGQVRLLHERVFLGEQSSPEGEYVSTTSPTDHTMLFRLYDLQTNRRANLFKRYLFNWQYFSLDPSQLRQTLARPLNLIVNPDGSNLASVLYLLKSAEERLYRKIVEATKRIEPKLDLINFFSPDPEHVFMFLEDGAGMRFSAPNVSEGTMRFLALCTIIIGNRRLMAGNGAAPLVMIEEPENGIFVGLLKPLLEMIDPSGTDGQYVFTSHAPYFIDLFDRCLDGIWLVRSDKTHSIVERPPRESIQAKLGQYSLGEMHFRGLLQ